MGSRVGNEYRAQTQAESIHFLNGFKANMTIRVKVYAPGFVSHDSVGTLYKKLKLPIPLRLVIACSVNYGQAKRNTRLKDGDIVTFLFPTAGG